MENRTKKIKIKSLEFEVIKFTDHDNETLQAIEKFVKGHTITVSSDGGKPVLTLCINNKISKVQLNDYLIKYNNDLYGMPEDYYRIFCQVLYIFNDRLVVKDENE